MPATLDSATGRDCVTGPDSRLLPVDPWRSLRVRFGMLLGVDDFETLDAYHRGKGWLHNAWLHRRGVVWGFGVSLDPEAGEVRVEPGLALDALGRELHLDVPSCIGVGAWLDRHADDPDLALEDLEDGRVRFDAHVVANFRGCLSRQVPALVEPCEGSGQTTTYSRVFETVELGLVAGPAPARGEEPYHRLRLLFGLEDPVEEDGSVVAADQAVLDARDAVAARPAAERPRGLLEAFRRFAALDAVDLSPADAGEGEDRPLFPATNPAPLVLADLRGLTLGDGSGTRPLEGGEVDVTVRPAHVATSTVQELLCGVLPAGAAGEDAAREGGPAVLPDSVKLTTRRVTFRVDRPLARPSLSASGVSVVGWDEDGWSDLGIARCALAAEGTEVWVDLEEDVEADRVRLLVRGTGPQPLLGDDLVPLGAAPGNPHDGRDFAFMIERS